MDALILLGVVVGLTTLLIWLEEPRKGRRYSGKIYDPQPRKSEPHNQAVRGQTGRVCAFCDAVTFGYGRRCGKCHRLPVVLPKVPVERTADVAQ